MKSVSILMVAQRFHPAQGGVEKHVKLLSKVLKTKGHEITVVTSKHTSGNLQAQELHEGMQIVRLPLAWERLPLLAFFWMIQRRKWLRGFRIVHVHDVYPLLFWYLPIRLLYPSQRVYSTFHGYEKDPPSILHRVLRKLALKIVDSCICIGDFIEKIYNISCNSIQIGAVRGESIERVITKDIVYMGRLERDNSILEYLDVMKILQEVFGIRLTLTICGSGSLVDEITDKTKKHRLDIKMLGHIKNPASILINHALCFAAGYLSVLEAMSLGIPVIALAQTQLKFRYYNSVRIRGGPISIQTTPRGVAKEVSRLLGDKPLYERISQKGIQFASNHTWERLADEYIKLWGLS